MTIPTVQKAVLLHRESTPYTIGDRSVPRPGPQDVLVKIFACALNPADYAVAEPPLSRILIQGWPHVPGCDGAGVVVQLGAEVTTLKEGDKVLFEGMPSPDEGTCQQYAIVPAEFTAIIPDNITFDQASTVPLTLTTLTMGLYNQSTAPENQNLRLKPVWEPEGATAYAGTPAFIIGGASSLGQYAIQLARLAGHNPIITTASLHNVPLLTSLGATHVLDRHRSNESILAELPTITGGRPFELVLVAFVSPEMLRLGRDAVTPGRVLATAAVTPEQLPEDVRNPGDGKRVTFSYGSPRLPWTRDTGLAMIRQITGWLEKGILKPNPVEVLPNGLHGVIEGIARIKAGKVSGKKLVAHPQETV